MTDKIQALAQSISEEFGTITVGGHGDTRGEYTVVDASPEEVAKFLAPKLIQPEWIDVKDSLPKVGQRVLVWNGYAVFDLDYIVHPFSKETAFFGPYDVRRRMGVTHWMPLPSPPEVKP